METFTTTDTPASRADGPLPAGGGVIAGLAGGVSGIGGACAACAGVGSAALVGGGLGATAAVRSVAVMAIVLAALAGVEIVRLRRSCPAGAARRRQFARRLGVMVVTALAGFAVAQLLLAGLARALTSINSHEGGLP